MPQCVTNGSALIELFTGYSPEPSDDFAQGADRIATSLNMVPDGNGTASGKW
jgi:hypothetical protein